ncbi:MAG: T9SS type A sorting domain-containing protein [Bacteroidales bacterium]|nr:T9SS type A sorting domain-containing protein [Bacteroidales bacterium]
MSIKYLIILIVLMPLFALSQDAKVLFIGNSFTYYNDLPSILENIGSDAGYDIYAEMYAPGGTAVGDTFPIEGPLAHMDNPVVYDYIRSNNWDYVVVQDNQGRFIYDYGVFHPDTRAIEGHDMLRDSVKFYKPCAHMIWFAGWALKNGYPPYGDTGIESIERIWANYKFMNDSLNEIIAPIGPTWIKTIQDQSSINLWSADEAHPSLSGSFLTALNIYYSIFKEKIESLNYTASLPASTVNYFNDIAFETVQDSMLITNLISTTPVITQSGNILSVEDAFVTYQWFKDGELVANEVNNELTIVEIGNYYLIAFDNEGCEYRSFSETITSLKMNQFNNDHLKIYPNPAKTKIVVEKLSEVSKIRITDAFGRLQKFAIKNDNSIDIELFAPGIYFIQVDNNTYKFVKQR